MVEVSEVTKQTKIIRRGNKTLTLFLHFNFIENSKPTKSQSAIM